MNRGFNTENREEDMSPARMKSLYVDALRDSFSLPPSLAGVSRQDLILYIQYLENKSYYNDVPVNGRRISHDSPS